MQISDSLSCCSSEGLWGRPRYGNGLILTLLFRTDCSLFLESGKLVSNDPFIPDSNISEIQLQDVLVSKFQHQYEDLCYLFSPSSCISSFLETKARSSWKESLSQNPWRLMSKRKSSSEQPQTVQKQNERCLILHPHMAEQTPDELQSLLLLFFQQPLTLQEWASMFPSVSPTTQKKKLTLPLKPFALPPPRLSKRAAFLFPNVLLFSYPSLLSLWRSSFQTSPNFKSSLASLSHSISHTQSWSEWERDQHMLTAAYRV